MATFRSGSVLAAGRIRLEHPIGGGGMGSVWRASYVASGTPLAIKVLRADWALTPDARARFEREAQALQRIASPHVVRVLEHGVEQGEPFMALELLEGEDLAARLRAAGRLGLADAGRLVAPLCAGLGAAHRAGVIHRDIKPGNIFLARERGREVVKLVDFGVAKLAGGDASAPLTGTDALVGSPRYMSPEQIRSSRQVDHRTDLWSLAVVLFQALTGQLPFDDRAVGPLILAITSGLAPPPSMLRPELGPAFDVFFARALARSPERRFQSAREMAEAFSWAADAAAGPGVTGLARAV